IYPAASLLVGLACEKLFRDDIKFKIASGIKYILIIASILILSFPFDIKSKRFNEIVRMAPVIDRILKQLPEYEFIVYKQDRSSILFYSQELSRVTLIKDKTLLEEALAAPYPKPRLCYMKEEDFSGLDALVIEKCRILLKYKDMIVIVSPKEPQLVVTLP
ncbi:MAG: hypothetical protein PHW54_04700, partial [Candidatus Omnitrophica bacterium]|nr:hypothetical protein [Candidatus Omnitrophota bacterium]